MDPLSVVGTVLALAEAAGQISKAISRLRHFGEVPGKIYALKNEISDLEVVLRQISHAVEHKTLAPGSAEQSLESLLERTKQRLGDLAKALERIANACAGSRIKVISKSTIWYREKEVFQAFRDDLVSIKASLNLLLGATNSTNLNHVILELQKVTILVAGSGKAGEDIKQDLNNSHTALISRMDHQNQVLGDRIDALGEKLLTQFVQTAEARTDGQVTPTRQEEGAPQTIRVVTSQSLPCRSWCPCSCHAKRKVKLASPGLVEGLFGRIFIGFSGLPVLTGSCDFRGCRDRRSASTTVEYWFPSWFISTNLKAVLTNMPMTGPEFLLSTTRRVADDSLSISFAMKGDITGLKHLFADGLAGPRDVSNSRGYTLMRWALYGGMHNHETVRFLINAGAKIDEASYDNVWDFVLRGKCTDEQQGALRCVTEGGADGGDWLDEQNFPLVHRIVLGLNSKSLAAELKENPHAVYLTDTQDRTALDWATARMQLEDIALLIKCGADPNNMDVTGRTPVLHAVDSHDAGTLRVILEAGGNPNPIYPKGMFRSSPLTAAGFAGMPTLLKLLLDFEADPNACNPEGLTALHSVARTHNTECALLLLEYGATLNAASRNGQTPLTTAIIHNNHRVLQLFVDRCHEYMTTMRFDGPEILPVIAEHADVSTINIIASVHPSKVKYDLSPDVLAKNRSILEQRRDYDETLGSAFADLISIVQADAEEVKSIDSVLESGFFLSARSTFRSDLAEAVATLESLEVSPAESSDEDEKGNWHEPKEIHSPTSPRSPISAIAKGHHPMWHRPRSRDGDPVQMSSISSPLRREISR